MDRRRWFHGWRLIPALADDGRRGYLLGIGCETDFAACSEAIQDLARDLAEVVVRTDPDGLDDGERPLLDQRLGKLTVARAIEAASSMVSETVGLTRFERLTSRDGRVGAYVHHDHRVGALVALTASAPPSELDRLLKELCLHVVAFTTARLDGKGAARSPSVEALLDQPWIHDSSVAVRMALARELGPTARIEALRFARLGID